MLEAGRVSVNGTPLATPATLVGEDDVVIEREGARAVVDQASLLFLAGSEIDFVEEISADFPINVLARLLDVPEADTGQLIAWGNEFVGATDPDFAKVRADLPESEAYKHLPFRSPTAR